MSSRRFPVKRKRSKKNSPAAAPSAAGYHELTPEERAERDKLAAERLEQLGYHSTGFQFRNAAKLLRTDRLTALQSLLDRELVIRETSDDHDISKWSTERYVAASKVLQAAGMLLMSTMPDGSDEVMELAAIINGIPAHVVDDAGLLQDQLASQTEEIAKRIGYVLPESRTATPGKDGGN